MAQRVFEVKLDHTQEVQPISVPLFSKLLDVEVRGDDGTLRLIGLGDFSDQATDRVIAILASGTAMPSNDGYYIGKYLGVDGKFYFVFELFGQ